MYFQKFFKWGILLAAFIAYKNADAMDTPQYVLDGERIVEQPYQSSLNHRSFLTLINHLRASSNKEMAATIERIRNKMAFTQEEARSFLYFTIGTYDQIMASRNSLTSYLMCSDASIDLTAGEKANLQIALDDLVDADLKKHFRLVEDSLDNHSKTNLRLWLAALDTDSGNTRVLHHPTDRSIPTRCNQLALARH